MHQACELCWRICWVRTVEGIFISSNICVENWLCPSSRTSNNANLAELLGNTWTLQNADGVPRWTLQHPIPLQILVRLYFVFVSFTLFYSDTKLALVRTALEASRAARSHAMDARITKQPTTQQLHTTAGLIAAKSAMVMGDANVFITAQCRIKSPSTKDQKNTDPSCGQWGKPWPKDAYMSGLSLVCSILHSLSNLIFRGSWRLFEHPQCTLG